MQSYCAAKRENRGYAASKAKHDCETSERPDLSQSAVSVPEIEIKWKREPGTGDAGESGWTRHFLTDFLFLLGFFILVFYLSPQVKRISEDDVAEQIMLRPIADVQRGIELEIARQVARKADRR